MPLPADIEHLMRIAEKVRAAVEAENVEERSSAGRVHAEVLAAFVASTLRALNTASMSSQEPVDSTSGPRHERRTAPTSRSGGADADPG